MPDDRSKRGNPDRIRVNIHEPYELRDWANHWGVSKETVIAAVHAVGVMAVNVEAYLRQQGWIR